MKRVFVVSLGLILLGGLLVFREWLLQKEIEATRASLRSQITEHLQSAQDVSRLQSLAKASEVFDRYLDPIFLLSSRLLWFPSRDHINRSWKRDVHMAVEDQFHSRRTALAVETKNDIERLKSLNDPGIERMVMILKAGKNLSTDELTDFIFQEIEAAKAASLEHDQALLKKIAEAGKTSLRKLKSKMKTLDARKLAHYLSSGAYADEIEQPVLSLIFQVHQKEVRKNAWKEFETNVLKTLGKVQVQLNKKELESRREEISKLSGDPIAQAIDQLTEAIGPLPLPANPSDGAIVSMDELYQ